MRSERGDKTSTEADRMPMSAGQTIGQHSTQGEITKLDEKNGWINVKTSEGTMIVQVPPSSLQGMKKGDTVTLDLSMKSLGSAGQQRSPTGQRSQR
jgi:hypothetical protein